MVLSTLPVCASDVPPTDVTVDSTGAFDVAVGEREETVAGFDVNVGATVLKSVCEVDATVLAPCVGERSGGSTSSSGPLPADGEPASR